MRLFGKKKKEENYDELKKIVHSFEKKTIHLAETYDCDKFSRTGGPPDVPPEFEWPVWNGKSLSFLMQLKFSELNPNGELENMPTSGLMYVFYDQDQSTWGHEPQDAGSWRILFYPETDSLKMRRYPTDMKIRYKTKHLVPKIITTLPSWEDKRIEALNLTEKQSDWYCEYCEDRFETPAHNIGGYACAIQDAEMDLDCALVAGGISISGPEGYADPTAKISEQNKEDWTLLLQIDSDEDAAMMWGDCGMIYFWIKKTDLQNLNFENVWMILQSY
jgi:uncharacterized protein YwqG